MNYKFLFDCKRLAFQGQHLNTIQLWARSGGRSCVTSSQNKTHLSDLLSDAREARVKSEADTFSRNGTAERKRGHVCHYVCVCCVNVPDKEHADPQSWLRSSPDKSVLRHTVMYPRAGSAEAAGQIKSSDRDKSKASRQKRQPTNKRWCSDARHAAAELRLCLLLHVFIWRIWGAQILQNVF